MADCCLLLRVHFSHDVDLLLLFERVEPRDPSPGGQEGAAAVCVSCRSLTTPGPYLSDPASDLQGLLPRCAPQRPTPSRGGQDIEHQLPSVAV